MRCYCVNICSIIKKRVISKCVFLYPCHSGFSIEADMVLFPQSGLWHREIRLFGQTKDQTVSGWLVLQVFQASIDVKKHHVGFISIQYWSTTSLSQMCQLQVWTSTLSLAAKLTTRRVSPPPEKQTSTSKVTLAFQALQGDHMLQFEGVTMFFCIVICSASRPCVECYCDGEAVQ